MSGGHAGERKRGQDYKNTWERDGSRIHVHGILARYQDDAWVIPGTTIEIEFFAQGAPIEIGFRTLRRGPAEAMLLRSATPASADSGSSESPDSPSGVALRRPRRPGGALDLLDSIGVVDIPPYNPDLPSNYEHVPCMLRLYAPNSAAPIQVWELEGGLFNRTRKVEFAPASTSSNSVAKTFGWWRCTLTVVGNQPAQVFLQSTSKIAERRVLRRTVSLRLLNRMLSLAIKAVKQTFVTVAHLLEAMHEVRISIALAPLMWEYCPYVR